MYIFPFTHLASHQTSPPGIGAGYQGPITDSANVRAKSNIQRNESTPMTELDSSHLRRTSVSYSHIIHQIQGQGSKRMFPMKGRRTSATARPSNQNSINSPIREDGSTMVEPGHSRKVRAFLDSLRQDQHNNTYSRSHFTISNYDQVEKSQVRLIG